MLLLTLLLIIWIETFYVLSLRIPDWTPDYPYQGWLAALAAKEVAKGGLALLWLFWTLNLLSGVVVN